MTDRALGDERDALMARLVAERDRTDALIRDLKYELAAIAESTAAGPDDEHDAEGSTVAYERARAQALLAHAERAAAAIEEATERAARARDRPDGLDGLIGLIRCERCGSRIPAERLIALPSTRTCVTCAAGR